MLYFLKCLLQLILSPAHGWEDISADARDERRLGLRGYLPLIGVVAASCFLSLLWNHTEQVTQCIISALVVFVVFFASFFIAMFLLPLKLSDYVTGELTDRRLSTFIFYSLGLMALIRLLVNCMPFDAAFTAFLPIYVAIIMWKGWRYMAVKPACQGWFALLAIITVMGPLYLLYMLFNMLL